MLRRSKRLTTTTFSSPGKRARLRRRGLAPVSRDPPSSLSFFRRCEVSAVSPIRFESVVCIGGYSFLSRWRTYGHRNNKFALGKDTRTLTNICGLFLNSLAQRNSDAKSFVVTVSSHRSFACPPVAESDLRALLFVSRATSVRAPVRRRGHRRTEIIIDRSRRDKHNDVDDDRARRKL